MRSSSNSGITDGDPDRSQTDNPERDRGHRQKSLYLVGIGPGSLNYLTRRASDVLETVSTVAGYKTYIDLIYPLIEGKQIIRTGMTQEVQRVEAAIDAACGGSSCALISSGDPGIYAMAGLVFEICQAKNIRIVPAGPNSDKAALNVEVIPGVPALCAGASLLGAPLTHDFATISLSDLLTPWEVIEKRIAAAARADFVIVLYNPKSKKRTWQLAKAQQILLKYRDENTPTGIVTGAMRKNQDVQIVALEKLHKADVNMQTTVFVGNSTSSRYIDFMVTPRGYAGKYKIE
ncbi:MAG: precorrin-3B C(17)-methyltransferase [Desulfobacterales bacterium]